MALELEDDDFDDDQGDDFYFSAQFEDDEFSFSSLFDDPAQFDDDQGDEFSFSSLFDDAAQFDDAQGDDFSFSSLFEDDDFCFSAQFDDDQGDDFSFSALFEDDDFYFSAQFDDDQGDHDSISDDKYALELQLQENLMSSVIASQNTFKVSSSSSPQPSLPINRHSSSPPQKPSVFGSSLLPPQPPPQKPSLFGSSLLPPQPPPQKPSLFGSPSPPQKPSLFGFSSPPPQPPQKRSLFSSSSLQPQPPPQKPSPFGFSSPPPQQPSLPTVRLLSSSIPPPPPIFRSSSSSTPPPTSSAILGFPSSSTTTTTPSPPIFRFTSSSAPPILRFSSSSKPPESPPILRFPSSSASSSSRAVKVKRATKTELIELVDDEQESGESPVMCEICAETKRCDQMFRIKRCDHSFCSDCIIKQVATKIQERITVVPCPGLNCKGVLELDACKPMLPKELLGKWEDALCEALFLAAPKLYCPFRDCFAMLLNENGGQAIREAECPFCHRLFCASCHVPWHRGVECEVFQSLNKDERGREDLLVRELASQKKWKRCPKCKYYVEKTEGCLHITCRCRFEFCYACGEQWTSTHGGCQRN